MKPASYSEGSRTSVVGSFGERGLGAGIGWGVGRTDYETVYGWGGRELFDLREVVVFATS
jgi:hypothetical protein